MTLRTLNYGNYGIFLIMGHAGFCPSAVGHGARVELQVAYSHMQMSHEDLPKRCEATKEGLTHHKPTNRADTHTHIKAETGFWLRMSSEARILRGML